MLNNLGLFKLNSAFDHVQNVRNIILRMCNVSSTPLLPTVWSRPSLSAHASKAHFLSARLRYLEYLHFLAVFFDVLGISRFFFVVFFFFFFFCCCCCCFFVVVVVVFLIMYFVIFFYYFFVINSVVCIVCHNIHTSFLANLSFIWIKNFQIVCTLAKVGWWWLSNIRPTISHR